MPPVAGAALVVLLEGFCVASLFPVTHKYCQQLGGGAVWIGALFALVPGPKVLMNPLWGRLSDRIGRRPVLALVTLGTLSSSLGWALAPGLGWLAASRLIAGLFGAQAALAQAVAADVTSLERRAAGLATLGAAFGLAITVGPLAGGLVGEHFSYAAVGWLCAATQSLSLGVILFVLPETHPLRAARRGAADGAQRSPAGPERFGRQSARLLSRPQVLRLLVATLVMTLGFAELTSTYGLFTERVYGFDATRTGYAFALLGLLAALVQGGGVRPLVARWRERNVAAGGMLALAAGFTALALRPPLWSFVLATALIALGIGLAVPCLTAMLSQRVGQRQQGSILGFNQSATGFGRALGFVLGGVLFYALGTAAPFASAAALILTALLVLLRAGRRGASPCPAERRRARAGRSNPARA